MLEGHVTSVHRRRSLHLLLHMLLHLLLLMLVLLLMLLILLLGLHEPKLVLS